MNLTEEVEALSKRNEEFLRELKQKHDFYAPYKECQEELRKLREAHGLLISMIQSQQLNVANTMPTPSGSTSFSLFGRLADAAREQTRSQAVSSFAPLPANRSRLDDPQILFRGRQSAAADLQYHPQTTINDANYDSTGLRNRYTAARRNRSSAGDMFKSFITCGTFTNEDRTFRSQDGVPAPLTQGEDEDEVVLNRVILNNEYLRMILRDPTL
jgi:hypothetical protein